MTNKTFNREVIRTMIEATGSKIFSVSFIKKDGTLRTMTCHNAVTKDLKGEQADERYRRGVATRAANNPNLLNVWDVQKKARRSINMDTVQSISISGNKYTVVQEETA